MLVRLLAKAKIYPNLKIDIHAVQVF